MVLLHQVVGRRSFQWDFLQTVTLYPIQYRSEVEISGSSEIVVAGSCLQRRSRQLRSDDHDVLACVCR